MGATSIEWTDWTANPVRARNRATGKVGHFCEKISPGCGHCYASEWNENRFGTGLPFIPQHRGAVEPFLDEGKLREVERRKKPTRVFWCDMTDLFLDLHPDEWIDQCLATMARTPQHTHQVLTKRPERMLRYFQDRSTEARVWGLAGSQGDLTGQPWPLPNVWLGVSAEDRPRWDERVAALKETPAAVRFVSVEPLLGDLGDIADDLRGERLPCPDGLPGCEVLHLGPKPIHWLIVGGESGAGARPCDLAWVRSVVAQCRAAGVPAFCKQLGSRPYWVEKPSLLAGSIPTAVIDDYIRSGMGEPDAVDHPIRLRDPKGGDPSEWPEDLRVREFPC